MFLFLILLLLHVLSYKQMFSGSSLIFRKMHDKIRGKNVGKNYKFLIRRRLSMTNDIIAMNSSPRTGKQALVIRAREQ